METAITIASLTERDRACIWHPFTQMQHSCAIPLIKGQGAYLYDEKGRAFLDAISSWWVNLHGHAHPYIAKQIEQQAHQLEHAIFAGFTHEPAIALAERLLKLLPGNMSKLFYSDNGSTAVEVALKIAIQFWHNKDSHTNRKRVICFSEGYHGDTFGAMSVAGKSELNRPFWSHFFKVDVILPPYVGKEAQTLQTLRSILEREETACFIFEPLVLGVAGMRMYRPEGLSAILELCHQYGVITIADEVMTGFGRTGPLFASSTLEIKPHMICLSKGITGGFLPLGVTACEEFIFEAFLSEDKTKTFLHGHSYTANPLACRAALANLDLLITSECTQQRQDIALSHQRFCQEYNEHPPFKRCESLGTILVVEYLSKETGSYFHSQRDALYLYFLKNGVLVRPLGNIVYLIPPYCITQEELQFVYSLILNAAVFFS
ncbi:MAG: adenosylmethionine--8-amino-7-oxononanoate transaminase [Parachlamydiaceae bacterium]|nr:adenosylmethionine--8-amino-7-oxononanoate transaminase [Parachlamydiaceae bacterium]